ncbi:MAG TPA: methyltransferase [Hyphomicrobiaceae bacterium]|nr:methyltransferase [Hyphomicrobiaceae bacterium]
MSRWATDADAAADALIARSLDALNLTGRVLLANPSPGLPAIVAKRGRASALWQRRLAAAGGEAQPWPPPGPFDVVLLRLAKAKDEQEMALHAALSVLGTSGRLLLYGGNDEGIRSAAAAVEELCGGVDTIARRGHGRLIAAERPANLASLRGELAEWRRQTTLTIKGKARPWTSYPGLFAADRIDAGSLLLIDTLPALAARAWVADFGCGAGVIAAALADSEQIRLDLIDHDSVALLAANDNVPSGRVHLGSSLAAVPGARYDAIISNPPLHIGVTESHQVLDQLILDAPAHLAPGGMLQVVVPRHLPLAERLRRQFDQVSVLAETGRYRVWQARRG